MALGFALVILFPSFGHVVSLLYTSPLQHLQAGDSVGSVSCCCFSLETAGGLHCNVSEVVVWLGPEAFENQAPLQISCWLVAK
jgi:hypothetical protein